MRRKKLDQDYLIKKINYLSPRPHTDHSTQILNPKDLNIAHQTNKKNKMLNFHGQSALFSLRFISLLKQNHQAQQDDTKSTSIIQNAKKINKSPVSYKLNTKILPQKCEKCRSGLKLHYYLLSSRSYPKQNKKYRNQVQRSSASRSISCVGASVSGRISKSLEKRQSKIRKSVPKTYTKNNTINSDNQFSVILKEINNDMTSIMTNINRIQNT